MDDRLNVNLSRALNISQPESEKEISCFLKKKKSIHFNCFKKRHPCHLHVICISVYARIAPFLLLKAWNEPSEGYLFQLAPRQEGRGFTVG